MIYFCFDLYRTKLESFMDISQSIEIMKSLADTSRLQILNSLMEKPQYVEEIANRIDLAESTVSFHLKKLENAGMVDKRREQYYTIYSINEKLFYKTLKELSAFENIDKYVQEKRINDYREKVLKTFFKGKKLLQLPVQKKKRMIILDEFYKKFESGRKYKEEKVNEIILTHFEDYCWIRRLMIEHGMMFRENQIYWINKNYKPGG